jgi:RimJ/RimL family protein N-acetyltransferase
MTITARRIRSSEADELAEWLAADEWPFHGTPRPDLATARRWVVEERRFDGEQDRSWWLVERGERVGLLALHELGDLTPVFDLRLRTSDRGRGLGRLALRALAALAFDECGKSRVEAHVRADNVAMRRCLRAAGWVKEAHHRRAWPDAEGAMHDCVTYALLRSDWESGTTTPVPFDEEP